VAPIAAERGSAAAFGCGLLRRLRELGMNLVCGKDFGFGCGGLRQRGDGEGGECGCDSEFHGYLNVKLLLKTLRMKTPAAFSTLPFTENWMLRRFFLKQKPPSTNSRWQQNESTML
jgi:hypothetical protein